MECDRAREMLWPKASPRAHTEATEAAQAHVATCAGCTAFFERDERLSRRLSGLDIAASTPPELHAALADALIRTPGAAPGSRFRQWRIPLAAAAVLSAFVAGLQISRTESRTDRADLFAEDFLRIAAVSPTNTDPSSIENFYQERIGFGIRPVLVADATVSKALVCDIRGARGATIEYEMDGQRLAHYRIPVAQLVQTGTGAVEMSVVGGEVQVARWVDGQYEHALVSTVSTKRMEELIRDEFGRDADF